MAQGEFALETFFEEINQRWKSYDLLVEDHLIDFHRKCKLIRRWEEILSKVPPRDRPPEEGKENIH